MNLGTTDLYILSQCAISAATQAGMTIIKNSDRRKNAELKEGGSSLSSQIVTEVDHLSQEVILQSLYPTLDLYDLALLAEESTDDRSRFEKDYFWSIDPIDGTLPFVEGTPGYSVSIALVSQAGESVIGVVFDPFNQNLYYAIKGGGCFRNGTEWVPKSEGASHSSNLPTFFFDRSFLQHPLFTTTVEMLKKKVKDAGLGQKIHTVAQGGAVMQALWALEKPLGCYFKFPKRKGGGSVWDYAATSCIYNEARAIASDIYGNSMELNREPSTFMNHNGILFAAEPRIAEAVRDIHETLKDRNPDADS